MTLTRILAADAADTLHMANATVRRRIFFIMVWLWILYFETILQSENRRKRQPRLRRMGDSSGDETMAFW